jgi:DNA adenine methylase
MRSPSRATAHGPSFLRWAGSKRKSLALLEASYHEKSRYYVEPFAGSAALFFRLAPEAGTLGDLNGQLINALRYVRDEPHEVHLRLSRFERSREAYYRIRAVFNQSKRFGLDEAVSFIYLNRNCFNGLWRTNLAGKFNVPFGGSEMGDYPPIDLLLTCSKLLKSVKIRHQDFRKTIDQAGQNAFIYADPPYFTASERVFVEYGKKSFGESDLNDLVGALVEAERRGAHVALTYHEAMEIDDLPDHWQKIRFEVTRNVGGFRGARKRQAEILYTSFRFIGEQ